MAAPDIGADARLECAQVGAHRQYTATVPEITVDGDALFASGVNR